MKLAAVVALGNPGLKYAATRHNAGVWMIDRLMQKDLVMFKKHRRMTVEYAKFAGVLYIKSTQFMNNSGLGIATLLRYEKIKPTEVLLLHDELDLKPGLVKLKFSGGDAGHNGIKSLSTHLNSRDFWRLRLGIGRPISQDVSSFVLGVPEASVRTDIDAAIALVAENFHYLRQGDEQAFMRLVHS